ncbi:terminase small subunit [Phytobacter diazotrophicus]|uniref:terminase small subunit n=1 Tax=Phytobacter diazotrophicus TaxID=395631 RepID=UPI0029360F86|nr:terminase small subunit [Phytobacter diazotrophicus]MDV2873331.1 terminase small subunit [Phytobacter diazotrophicus]
MQPRSIAGFLLCREYLIVLNPHASSYTVGYSVKTANRIAPQNVSKFDILNRIAELEAKRQRSCRY